MQASRHNVAALVTHGVAPFELGIACEVFGLERPEIVDPWPYRFFLCGFGSASVLRTHFKRLLDTSPLAYRRMFRRADAVSA